MPLRGPSAKDQLDQLRTDIMKKLDRIEALLLSFSHQPKEGREQMQPEDPQPDYKTGGDND